MNNELRKWMKGNGVWQLDLSKMLEQKDVSKLTDFKQLSPDEVLELIVQAKKTGFKNSKKLRQLHGGFPKKKKKKKKSSKLIINKQKRNDKNQLLKTKNDNNKQLIQLANVINDIDINSLQITDPIKDSLLNKLSLINKLCSDVLNYYYPPFKCPILPSRNLMDLIIQSYSHARRNSFLIQSISKTYTTSDTENDILYTCGVSCNQAAKPVSTGTSTTSTTGSPFLGPFITGSHICSLNSNDDKYRLIFNKYPILPYHLLIVSCSFISQKLLLTLDDINITFLVFKSLLLSSLNQNSLIYYNVGGGAGATQLHRHIHIIPNCGNYLFLNNISDSQRKTVVSGDIIMFCDVFKFIHCAILFDINNINAQQLYKYYLLLINYIKNVIKSDDLHYNLLITDSIILIIPRKHGAFIDNNGNQLWFSAAPFAGLILCSNNYMNIWKQNGFINILTYCCFPLNINNIKPNKSEYYNHIESRITPYINTNHHRCHVEDDLVSWNIKYINYKPFYYTCNDVDSSLLLIKNDIKYRKSYCGIYKLDISHYNLPLNPFGRTGIYGKGCLSKWGPNHYIYIIITKWNNNILQFIAIKSGISYIRQWLIPSHQSEHISLIKDNLDLSNIFAQIIRSNIVININNNNYKQIFCGYCDDQRNTDNSWCETIVYNYHDNNGNINIKKLRSKNKKIKLKWMNIDKHVKLYSSHKIFIKKVAKLHNAHW